MKKIYVMCVGIFCAAVVVVFANYNRKEKEKQSMVYELLPRKGAAANTVEWKAIHKKVHELNIILKQEPTDMDALTRLSALYIQEARETGNYMYYDKAAMKSVNAILKIDSVNFNALVYKSLIYLSQHHFAEGLATAQKAQRINPYNAYVYGLMVDGYVETGNYDAAVADADKMVGVRPDLTSYSRVSYLREIFGNYKSAIEAMKMAGEAGGRGDEHTEWTRVQLGNLYEKTGDYKKAKYLYNESLSMRPDYPYALAGLARVAVSENNPGKAVELYEKADSLINDNSIKEELVDLYHQLGQKEKADRMAYLVIEDLSRDAQAGTKDQEAGHYADRELAYAYLKVNKTDKAFEHAMLEYNRRPENIDVNETVAWVYYNMGDYDKALPYIKAALRTNSKNPILLSRAGLIYYKSGKTQLAKSMLQEASIANSYVGYSLKAATSIAMQSL